MSSSASELETTTETRTNVEAEEVTLYKCPAGCGQHVEEEELVPVRVGEGDEEIETVACEYCARSQYGFDADASTQSVPQQIGDAADSFAEVVALPVARAVLPLVITAVPVVVVATSVLNNVQSMTVESEQATLSLYEVSREALVTLSTAFPTVVLAALVIITVFRLMVSGPRM